MADGPQPAAPGAAAPMSFKSAIQKEKKDQPIKTVKLSGSVVLKILQFFAEPQTAAAFGHLLGLDVGSELEVTECFPVQATENSEAYGLQKMRCLREINVDSNMVGWFQCAAFNEFQTVQLIDTFVSYDVSLKKYVCVICDMKESQRGGLGLRAYRLNKPFVELYKKNPNLTAKELYSNNITWRDMFQQVPLRVSNSPLITAMAAEIERSMVIDPMIAARLRLNTQPLLESSLELMGDGIDNIHMEVQDVTKYDRARARQEQQKAAWLVRRKEENYVRKQNGEEPLPEDDPVQFKPLEPPSLVASYLCQQQLASTCDNANSASCELLHKLQIADCLRL